MKKYWYFLLIACLCSVLSPQIDKAMVRLIPDKKTRARVYQIFLFTMTIVFAILILVITKNTMTLPVRLFLSLFPLACALIGTLISGIRHKRN